ncbi:hypothetical protein BsWGS_16723 [Bradybaena similaris]
MMRWLKDKKKEKRSNSTSQNDGEKEDDYGFGKEKPSAKSPSSRRQLPPTPATPEEKSPHIYEEIPDLPLCCMPDNEKALLQNKFGKSKHGSTAGVTLEGASAAVKPGASQKDDINPYMVVPVDKEIRQTPTEFHRNGTPEVHCDVIVKDTHCEILLSRKPKVGTFRLDNAVLSGGAENANVRRNGRSNTHLFAHDKRAAADVYSGGNQSSAFSVTSSAFSSSSASKIQASGASSLTLVNVFDQHPFETCEDSSNGNAVENGVITYSSASNFIPRSTNLVFNPLPGKNPCKEVFGSDSSDEIRAVGYSSVKEDKKGVNSVSFISARDQHMGSQCVTYASIQPDNDPNNDPDCSIDSHVTYASVQEQHYADEKMKPNYSFDEPLKTHQPMSLTHNNDFGGTSKTGMIQSLSPSTSSNCIYALVTFPAEPKHYNTISDITLPGFQENISHREKSTVHSNVNELFGCEIGHPSNNTEINDLHTSNDFSRISFHVNSPQNAGSQPSHFNFSKRVCGDFSLNQFHYNPGNVKCVDNTVAQMKTGNGQTAINGTGQDRICKQHPEFAESSGHAEHQLELEFCLCSDEHSSSCGCPDDKHSQDDDVSSVAGATNEGSGSCRSCGRLIRQITYSESYSDETYEHVYASRLLIRTGRRFSSPDITFSEVSNSEFQDIQNPHSLDFPYAVSRDDSWTSTRGSDIIPPPYNAAASGNILKSVNMTQVKKMKYSEALGLHAIKTDLVGQVRDSVGQVRDSVGQVRESVGQVRESVGQFQGQLCCTGDTPQSSSAGSKVTSTVHTLGCSSNQWDPAGMSAKHSDCSFDGRICDKLNTESSRDLAEPIITPSQKLDSVVNQEPKSSAFTGLLSMFSRTKSSKSSKPDEPETSNISATLADRAQDTEVIRCDKLLEEIPEKNTRKLSKFFQRLSNKDVQKGNSVCVASPEIDSQACSYISKDTGTSNGKAVSFKTSCFENSAVGENSQKCRDDGDYTASSYKGKNMKEESQICKGSTYDCEQRVGPQAQLHVNKSHSSLSEAAAGLSNPHSNLSEAAAAGLSETASAFDKDTNKASNAKSQCKTDSGDTCYEYDISTSSEGEQTGYEYFLSKVRKTLNLEHEVQHIAESSAARRKRICKRCKREGLYTTIDDDDEEEDNDGLCPHFAAKFGDLRAIFDDMVVDQRAAILDCLTDFMHSPYNIRGHSHDGFCRECGCEILTSDSESQTTVCSLLSQQLYRMTSPNGQGLSCDSDEGTMADNSCESADDDNEENRNGNDTNCKKSPYDDNSSGYDEPKDKLGHLGQKLKKKDKRPRLSIGIDAGSKENASENHENTHSLAFTNIFQDTTDSFAISAPPSESVVDKQQFPDRIEPTASSFPDSTQKSNWKNNSTTPHSTHSSKQIVGLDLSHGLGSSVGNVDHSRVCDTSRSRASFVTDKVLQDIYVPLPSKALSLIASKNYGPPAGLPCTCGRGLQASTSTVTAHLGTGKTELPPTGCIEIDGLLQPSSAGVVHCDGDKKSGVAPVQKHLRNRKKTIERELFNFSERKDSDDPEIDRQTMGAHPENAAFANNGCSLTWKNAESNDVLASQTKPGSHVSKKERALVPSKDGRTKRTRPPAKESRDKSDCGLAKISHEGEDKCSSILPHTMARKDSANLVFTADSSTDQHSASASSGVVQEFATVEIKTDKMKYARRYRLELSALDLLPESAVDGDPTAAKTEHVKRVLPKRSKVIEKMAKIFENSTCADDSRSDKNKHSIAKDIVLGKQNITRSELDNKDNCAHSSKHVSQLGISGRLISDNGKIVSTKFAHVHQSKRNVREADLCNLQKRDKLYAMSESSHLNFNASPPVSDIKDRPTMKTRRSSSESRRDKDKEIKPTGLKSDTESSTIKTNELKSGRVKTGKGKMSAVYLTESRLAKQRSPTPSTSSASSSSGKRSGHGKHKLSKKSYSRKRSKHRAERAKNGHGKEERTYYYFSSDFSDIDVVETENSESCNTFTATHTTQSKVLVSAGKKQSISDKKLAGTSESAASTGISIQNKNIDVGECEQEVYALPNDSVDMRRGDNCTDKNAGPNSSPEIRHTKRTDVYKSKKSNNKLLSDLIIRNYDMQLYENV